MKSLNLDTGDGQVNESKFLGLELHCRTLGDNLQKVKVHLDKKYENIIDGGWR